MIIIPIEEIVRRAVEYTNSERCCILLQNYPLEIEGIKIKDEFLEKFSSEIINKKNIRLEVLNLVSKGQNHHKLHDYITEEKSKQDGVLFLVLDPLHSSEDLLDKDIKNIFYTIDFMACGY